MKTVAAVLIQTGEPLEIAELEIPCLNRGQVLVEVQWSGVCHTQLLEVRGYRGPDRFLPHCLGHEGTGRVVEVGGDVAKCQPGDQVVLSWMKGSGADVPGTVYRWGDREVNAGGVTTFQRHAVVSENRCTPLPKNLGEREGALLGCALPTGFGAIYNTAQATAGQSVVVFGTGGIGLAAVAAAADLAADPLIAVDLHDQRLALARRFGATHCLNASDGAAIGAQLAELCPRGADLAIEATGRPRVMQQALESVRARGGTVVIIGNARHGQTLQIDPQQLNQGKRLLGTWGGDNSPDEDFPRYAQVVHSRQIDLTALSPQTYSLSQINEALADLETGRVTRPLIELA